MIIGRRRLTLQEMHARDGNWHRWFAWRPVAVGSVMVWLQFVERRSTSLSLSDYGGMVYEYRMPA